MLSYIRRRAIQPPPSYTISLSIRTVVKLLAAHLYSIHPMLYTFLTFHARYLHYAATFPSLISHLSSCSRLNTSLPSSVNSGFPSGVVAPTKNRGVHTVPASSLSFAFCRCPSSSSCLSAVARENCRAVIASVTPPQKRKDSLGSWTVAGGRTLDATERGARSIIRFWVSCAC